MLTPILVADDDDAARRLLLHSLRSLGCEIVAVSDGESALAAIHERAIQVALLDWDMPGLTGIEICERLQAWHHFVHAIMVTANTSREDLTRALRAGASDFIRKPFDSVELCARVRVGLRIAEMQERLSLSQKLESVGMLAAGVAHEINTPAQYVADNLRFMDEAIDGLTRIVAGYERLRPTARGDPRAAGVATAADVASEWEKIDRVREELDIDFLTEEAPLACKQASDGVARIAKIVRSMKEFTHPGQNTMSPANLNDAIENTIQVCEGSVKDAAVVETELAPSLPDVPCMISEINQVILNLIVNAADAIREKGARGGTIRVSTDVVDGMAEIRVADDGGGIPAEVRAKIFDPFFTTKQVGKGTGQGLAIAHRVVRSHDGSIEARVDEGVGTTFVVRLPLLRAIDRPLPGVG